ncbi:redox-regulated ATPase YchF [Candidatus Uhrbacteria bacterium]|nr:redox-regulated ATPase YchF [Candidatus Uhrbacteria bacterium]
MLQVGIVGLPNVGKSTLFKTLTKKQVDCANFPFCTIEPNVGVVEVPDERLKALAEVSKSQKIIPTAIEFVDIAGLVKGAHKGEGLGNKFLANIRDVDMILHVVREFSDSNVIHVDGDVDPARDVETIEVELAMADFVNVEKRLDGVNAKAKSGMTKEIERQLALLEKLKTALAAGHLAKTVERTDDDALFMRELSLLTDKPILYVVNINEASAADASWKSPLGEARTALPISVKVESEIVDLPASEQKEFLDALGLKQTGLDRLITKCYEMLGLVTYFTSGEKETRAWTIVRGTKAPQAAGVIHTDFEKTFIRAEIIFWKDLVELGEGGAREAGKLRIEGKDYIMQDGDTAHFRVGA